MRYTLFLKEREVLTFKYSSVTRKARVKPVKPWTYPSMVLVPLCTAMVMAWPLQRELRFPLATFHYHSLPPAFWERKLRLSFL